MLGVQAPRTEGKHATSQAIVAATPARSLSRLTHETQPPPHARTCNSSLSGPQPSRSTPPHTAHCTMRWPSHSSSRNVPRHTVYTLKSRSERTGRLDMGSACSCWCLPGRCTRRGTDPCSWHYSVLHSRRTDHQGTRCVLDCTNLPPKHIRGPFSCQARSTRGQQTPCCPLL